MRKRTNLFGVPLALPGFPVLGILLSAVLAVSNCTMERISAKDAIASSQPTPKRTAQEMDYVLVKVPDALQYAISMRFTMNGKFYQMVGVVVKEEGK